MEFRIGNLERFYPDEEIFSDFDEAIKRAKEKESASGEVTCVWDLERWKNVPEVIIYKGYHYLNESTPSKD